MPRGFKKWGALFFRALTRHTFLYRQNRPIFERVRRALLVIAEDPHQGKPLKFELKGKWSYRVGVYRIIYIMG